MWNAGSFSPLMPPNAFPQYPPNIPQMSGAGSGHQIPMLSADVAGYGEQPPLQKIPPTPADCLPQTGGIDWAIIASSSPEDLAESNDIDTLSAIIQSFVHSEFTQTEAQLMPNPLTSKFFRILQIGIRYLLDCQQQLKEDLNDSNKSLSMIKTKAKALSAALLRAKDASKRSERVSESTEKCVVCGRRFKNINYLDGHIQRRHGSLMPAWRSLRTGQLQGMEDFAEQIENLRKEVAKTHHELEKRSEKASLQKPVTHVVSHSDEQLKMMNELIKKQDEMMTQARELEDKQLNFRREMRNQLDDAVIALQEAQKKLDAQANMISQIPSMPPPSKEPIRQDELGESLTEQLMKPSLNKQRVAFDLESLINDVPAPPFEVPAIKIRPSLPSKIENDEDNKKSEDDDSSKPTSGKQSVSASRATTVGFKLDESDEENVKSAENDDSSIPQRDKQHNKIIQQLQVEGEEPIVPPKPFERVLTKKEQILQLLRQAHQLGEHEIDPNESPNRDVAIASITEGVLKSVDQKLAELKRTRPYAPLSVPYVSKKMKQNTKEFGQTYTKLQTFVGSEVPSISDEYKKNLFNERKTRFPLVPPIERLNKKGKQKDHAHAGALPKIPESAMIAAGKKLPFRQRQSKNRPRLLPGDSDVEIVDRFSDEISSESVGYRDDPNYYKRIFSSSSPKIGKDGIEEMHMSSTSSSEIKPLKDDDDMKILDMNQFADLSSSSTDEEIDDGTKTKQLNLKGANKTKTMKLPNTGSADFDVTKKQSTKGTTASDEIFDLSKDSDSPVSMNDDLTNSVKNTSLTDFDDDSGDDM